MCCDAPGIGSPGGGVSKLVAAGTVNQNVDPAPGVLLTPIAPPCASVKSLLMYRPRPTPLGPRRPPGGGGSRVNFSNTRGWSPGAIPGPWSVTATRSMPLSAATVTVSGSPGTENLQALATMLVRICHTRCWSALANG